jgi:outer membrane lipoprotein carrier protein
MKKSLFLAFFFLAGPIFAQESTSTLTMDSLIDKLAEKEKTITDVRFKFTQTVEIKLTNDEKKTSGTVIYQKPNKLHIKLDKPYQQTIISDGKQVWIYTPAYNQVMVGDWNFWERTGMLPKEIFNFGQTAADWKKDYKLSMVGQDNGYYELALATGTYFNTHFWISEKTLFPEKTKMVTEGASVTTESSNVEFNVKPEERLFRFNKPKGVEVIKAKDLFK